MKKLQIVIMVAILVFSLSTIVSAENSKSIPQDVLNAAINGVDMIKGQVSANLTNWGLNNQDEVNKLTLGEGLHVKYVNSEKINKIASNNLSELIDTTKFDTWEFIVCVDGKAKMLLTIGFEDGKYTVLKYGGRNLAEMIETALENFKTQAKVKGVALEPSLIKHNDVYYITSKFDHDEYVLSVASEAAANKITGSSDMNYNKIKTASEFIKHLKTVGTADSTNEEGGNSFGSDNSNSGNISLNRISANSNLYIVLIAFAIGIVAIAIFTFRRKVYTNK